MYGGNQYSNRIYNDNPQYTAIKNKKIPSNLILFETVLLLTAPIVIPCYLIHSAYKFITKSSSM